MTESELRRIVCTQAARWIGRCEGNGSHREIIDVYNSIEPLPRGYRMTYYDPWCAAFVSAVAQACGLTDILFPECACDPMIALYKKAGRWMERDDYRPDPGDLIMYDWQDTGYGDNAGSADHVGMVEKVEGNTIWIIEGNCADAVLRQKRSINSMNIRGFCLPDYAAAAAAEQVVIEDGPAAAAPEEPVWADAPGGPEPGASDGARDYELPLHTLRRGDSSEEVRAAQILLIGRGYSCGPDGADGDFGPNTCAAVRRFQSARSLPVNGEIGQETMAALHGL